VTILTDLEPVLSLSTRWRARSAGARSRHTTPAADTHPDRTTCGVRVLTVFPSPPRPRLEPGERYEAFTLRPSRPAFVPRTTGRRQETVGTAGASNPQVRDSIRASPLVAKSAPRTLSRWRHGFKSRWDYAGQRPYRGVTRANGPALAPRRTRGRHDNELSTSRLGPVRGWAEWSWPVSGPPRSGLKMLFRPVTTRRTACSST
jgi:hypothetical protein